MQSNVDIGFDESPEGAQVIALLRRHAPPPPDVEAGREAVLARLPAGRVRYLNWFGAAVGAAAAVMIAFVLINSDQPVEITPTPEAQPQYAAPTRGNAPELVAMVRGASGEGWRIDAGLKDGLRVGDKLAGQRGEYIVTAAGIFDSRVTGPAVARGERLARAIDTSALERAAAMAAVGGDPGGFFDFGAVFEALPVEQARQHGIADGRALRVTETISTILRDFAAQSEPSLAARLGLKAGDVIVQVNGYSVADLNQLANALEWSRRSGSVQATVIRAGRTIELQTG